MANPKQNAFEAGLKKLMVAARPEMMRRLHDVEKAVVTYSKGEFVEEARELGHSQAHKLAGVLGTYGLTMGSRIAHQLEVALEAEAEPDLDLMTAWIEELRQIISGK